MCILYIYKYIYKLITVIFKGEKIEQLINTIKSIRSIKDICTELNNNDLETKKLMNYFNVTKSY